MKSYDELSNRNARVFVTQIFLRAVPIISIGIIEKYAFHAWSPAMGLPVKRRNVTRLTPFTQTLAQKWSSRIDNATRTWTDQQKKKMPRGTRYSAGNNLVSRCSCFFLFCYQISHPTRPKTGPYWFTLLCKTLRPRKSGFVFVLKLR